MPLLPTVSSCPPKTLACNGGPKVREKAWPARHLFGEEERQAVNALFDEVIQSGVGIGYNGPHERAYCEAFSEFLGGGYADAVNSGTNALFVALASLDLPPYSEVIVPPITDAGGVMPVTVLNCIPVPADVAPGGFNVGADQIRACITDRTRAIIVMHAAGLPVDMDPVMRLARKHGLKVIEDCAQAHGSTYHGQPVGTFGDVAAFSTMFGKTHAFGGQGGVVFTRDEALHHRIREISDRGKPSNRPEGTRNVIASLNFSCDELHACIGRTQLKKLPDIMRRRQDIGRKIASGCAKLKSIRMVDGLESTDPVYWFVLFHYPADAFTTDKATFVEALQAEGIPFEADYNFIPCEMEWFRHQHCLGTSGHPWNSPQYKGSSLKEYPLPNTKAMIREHFRLIIHESLGLETVDDILKALHKVEAVFHKSADSLNSHKSNNARTDKSSLSSHTS